MDATRPKTDGLWPHLPFSLENDAMPNSLLWHMSGPPESPSQISLPSEPF